MQINYIIKGAPKMAENKKNEIINWINFGVAVLGVIAKVIKEILDIIPQKEK